MNTIVVVIIVIVVIAVVAAAGAYVYRRRQSSSLQERFGPEYERTVRQAGHRRSAEKVLHEREKRRSSFDVTPLSEQAAAAYRSEWAEIQQGFVDEPAGAVRRADVLVVRMMRDSGYPVDDFERRADDISVDHPDVAQHYREAHAVAVKQVAGEADTEQLRQAVTSYRELVAALLDDSSPADGPSPTYGTRRSDGDT
ncbi:MAG: hypothetical protein J7518_09395 [Nocardioidaceae bacterium]|nr:hypothetical protein [Nocardioidaceae bacterium]